MKTKTLNKPMWDWLDKVEKQPKSTYKAMVKERKLQKKNYGQITVDALKRMK